ncbi:Endonuclease/exonuclease/phosphatase [Trinorchestia longiramus]|nr:Endonuclease/exonuclease/phosphatase [Trinorchestia longiramus]
MYKPTKILPQLPGSTQNTCFKLTTQEEHHTTKKETEQRQKQEQTQSTYAEIPKLAIQQTNPSQHTLTLTNQTHIKLTALILEAHIAALDKTKKFCDILTQSLKLKFNIDTTLQDRDSTAIFTFFYDKTDMQQPQTTQTAPQKEHTMDLTIDAAVDETDTATYTEIRQKRRISDKMEASKRLMDNKYTAYVKLYRNYANNSPIPDNPTMDWFADEPDKDQDNDKGLQLFTQDLKHQPVLEMLRRMRALFLHIKINIVPHEQFITLPRYHTTIIIIKTHNIKEMIPSKLIIIQHNVQSWTNKRITLSNFYNTIDPDIIFINVHSLINSKPLKIFYFNIFFTNKYNEHHARVAIAIKRHIPHKLHDTFHSDMLAITIDTQQGPITIGTTYTPPRTEYLHFIDFYNLFNRSHPIYFFGDINAAHRTLGHTHNNTRGSHLHTLITRYQLRHIGPNFPTLITHKSTTSPDIALQNKHTCEVSFIGAISHQ